MNNYIESDFEYPKGFHLMSSNSPCSLPSDGLCDSSFSCAASYDECFTPSRRGSSGVIDMDDLSFFRSSFGSNGSNSPVDDARFYAMPNMIHNVKPEMLDFSHLHMTPCKSNSNHGMMANYNASQVNNADEPCTPWACLGSLPAMSFDNMRSLLFGDSKSPIQMDSSPPDFVIPSQTFLSEPYRPTTPTQDLSIALLASPLASYSQPPASVKYFMSPRDKQMQTQKPGSETSFKSNSTSHRSPSSHALDSSAALHHVQSLGASRIRKVSKRSQVKAKIERVPAGLFHCNFEGCKSEQKGFKRHEHLKRHQRTHTDNRQIQCQFCPKMFQLDRMDNYKSHLCLHTIPKEFKRGSRTDYFPEAQALYDSLCEKKRSTTDKLDRSGDRLSTITRKSKSSLLKSDDTQ